MAEYLDSPRMRTVLNRFHENVAADRAEADLLYKYTFGGASAIGRMLRKIAP
ncbi:MAG: hypothetical protein V4734_05165 [Terriglobus sp.]